MSFLNRVTQAGKTLFTSARDNGDGEPVTDIHVTGSNTVLPVDVEGIKVADGEKMPIERAPYSEYKQGDSVPAGVGTLFNHTVQGNKIGIGVRWETATDFTVEVGYIVPGTDNSIMIPYEEVLNVTGSDNGGVVIDAKNKFARIRISNNGTADATITTCTLVDF